MTSGDFSPLRVATMAAAEAAKASMASPALTGRIVVPPHMTEPFWYTLAAVSAPGQDPAKVTELTISRDQLAAALARLVTGG